MQIDDPSSQEPVNLKLIIRKPLIKIPQWKIPLIQDPKPKPKIVGTRFPVEYPQLLFLLISNTVGMSSWLSDKR